MADVTVAYGKDRSIPRDDAVYGCNKDGIRKHGILLDAFRGEKLTILALTAAAEDQ